MAQSADRSIIDEQIAYYRARAGEYDEWFLRTGRYDRGEEHRNRWFGEVAILEAALETAKPHGDCLELACGTGLWTHRLAQSCDSVTAVDASPEVIEINRGRVGARNVTYLEADLFQWAPEGKFDFIFFSFWLSHVPVERFDRFWAMIGTALAPGGKVFIIDSLLNPESTATDHSAPGSTGVVTRKLNDGQTFQVVKLFYAPEDLAARMTGMGWRADLRASGEFFIYGELSRP